MIDYNWNKKVKSLSNNNPSESVKVDSNNRTLTYATDDYGRQRGITRKMLRLARSNEKAGYHTGYQLGTSAVNLMNASGKIGSDVFGKNNYYSEYNGVNLGALTRRQGRQLRKWANKGYLADISRALALKNSSTNKPTTPTKYQFSTTDYTDEVERDRGNLMLDQLDDNVKRNLDYNSDGTIDRAELNRYYRTRTGQEYSGNLGEYALGHKLGVQDAKYGAGRPLSWTNAPRNEWDAEYLPIDPNWDKNKLNANASFNGFRNLTSNNSYFNINDVNTVLGNNWFDAYTKSNRNTTNRSMLNYVYDIMRGARNYWKWDPIAETYTFDRKAYDSRTQSIKKGGLLLKKLYNHG